MERKNYYRKDGMMMMYAKDVTSLIGKKIEWYARGDRSNGNYGGIAIITAYDEKEHNPISCEIVEGCDMNYSFIDSLDNSIAFSDLDRAIFYKIIE